MVTQRFEPCRVTSAMRSVTVSVDSSTSKRPFRTTGACCDSRQRVKVEASQAFAREPYMTFAYLGTGCFLAFALDHIKTSLVLHFASLL